GGNAGAVTVNYDGNGGQIIAARGSEANETGGHGIQAQSIGGSGGNGGVNVSAGLSFTKSSATGDAFGVVFGIGGFGGGGGTADTVDVTVADTTGINVIGKESSGIQAQSIGGGGGNGGTNITGGITSDSSLLIGIGGSGGDGNIAKAVTVDATVNIQALGAPITAPNNDKDPDKDGVPDFFTAEFFEEIGVTAVAALKEFITFYPDSDVDVASSAGILAQSIGGGGGNGALNVTGGIILSKSDPIPSVTFGIGGNGGKGAIAGNVTVNHRGTIFTQGDWKHGIAAQSIGGGGGHGGINVSGQFSGKDAENSGGMTDVTVIAGIGGSAGEGGTAGNVSVTQSGAISTQGKNSRGIFAQSVGGGGGTGGANFSLFYAQDSSPIQIAVGGSGDKGGSAGNVIVNRGTLSVTTGDGLAIAANTTAVTDGSGNLTSAGSITRSGLAAGKIITNGDGGHAIEASSIGGGGGDAGMSLNVGKSGVGSGDSEPGFAATILVGGRGGEADHGSTAIVNNYADLETQGNDSHGILAQSIGGGGGNANINIALSNAKSKDKEKNTQDENNALAIGIGGDTGNGGFGDKVKVVHAGAITTLGRNSFGILAQSIGGGGGNAGMTIAMTQTNGGAFGFTLGQKGGKGGFGSDVSLFSDGTIQTLGAGSFGLLAQSIGNGGGNSSSTSVNLTIPSQAEAEANSKTEIKVAIGIEGGEGGNAGNVVLNASGAVSTQGEKAHAIFAQSVGGGGGNGGSGNTLGITAKTFAFGMGGTGGTGGFGGNVAITSDASVRTNGDDSVGILAQSIGGGGGTGGTSATGGAKATSNEFNARVAIGGSGGIGTYAGKVNVSNSGDVITTREGSHAVLAQSIGGGGGNGGMAISSVLKESSSPTDASSAASGSGGGGGSASKTSTVSVTVGGSGGDGGRGNTVTVNNTGFIGTDGASSVGVFAQSIGGGGGNGKLVLSNQLTSKDGNTVSVTIGGAGGTGGAGDVVNVNNSATIITTKEFSHGIMAMSLGGGGGNGSTVVSN
ncbi:MAG TPA: hypothetical protein VLL52_08485, partial [Anaerolineae bacterium]|nr:hypothetical protein [Anaerolineae bacterium]